MMLLRECVPALVGFVSLRTMSHRRGASRSRRAQRPDISVVSKKISPLLGSDAFGRACAAAQTRRRDELVEI
jgi:hypothetical protein